MEVTVSGMVMEVRWELPLEKCAKWSGMVSMPDLIVSEVKLSALPRGPPP